MMHDVEHDHGVRGDCVEVDETKLETTRVQESAQDIVVNISP